MHARPGKHRGHDQPTDQHGQGQRQTTPAKPDCEPFNPNVFNGQVERCNGIDDNCDGVVDEENALGCQELFYDFDDDGYGTDLKKCLCAASGYYRALEPGDCADTDNTSASMILAISRKMSVIRLALNCSSISFT